MRRTLGIGVLPRGAMRIALEWKAALRGVRGRGWAGVFAVLLLGAALAAGTIMFSVADSLVFAPTPFEDADRIVLLSGRVNAPERIDMPTSAALVRQWREQPDLVAAAGSWIQKNVFLRGDGLTERIETADVTVGFFDVLGVRPRWGRDFTDDDAREHGTFAVILSEDLARRRFGSPARALGQTIDVIALVASRWLETQMFGVSATDPATYAAAAGAAVIVSILATWWPVRQAASVDPAVTLRAE